MAVNNQVYAVCGLDKDNKPLNSIEVLGVRVNSSGGVSWVSQACKTFDLEDFTPRTLPLVAPLQNNRLLVYGGKDQDGNVLYDGLIIDLKTKAVTHRFKQPQMPLYSVCSGQITPYGEVLAFGVVNKDTLSQAVRFDESENRFQSLSTILNKEKE